MKKSSKNIYIYKNINGYRMTAKRFPKKEKNKIEVEISKESYEDMKKNIDNPPEPNSKLKEFLK